VKEIVPMKAEEIRYGKELTLFIMRLFTGLLTPAEEAALLLRCKGKSYQQIANKIEVPQKRARYLVMSAIAELRKMADVCAEER